MTDPDRSTGVLLTQDEVMAALATPLPSELLLKGTVANEVSQMENKLEDKVKKYFYTGKQLCYCSFFLTHFFYIVLTLSIFDCLVGESVAAVSQGSH